MSAAGTPFSSEKMHLNLLKEGDRKAFELVFNSYWSKLYLYAYNILRDKGVCEDIVQEVLVSLWVKRESQEIDSLGSFLFTAVRYQVLKVIRSGKVREGFFQEIEKMSMSTPAEQLEEKDLANLIDARIDELPGKCREIFLLSRKEQLSNREIAERLGISIKTVENQITIAIRRLRSDLGDVLFLSAIVLILGG
ncbi:RNA polymerase sigma-70 factor [Desertivirga arenae]|uniref:RNA polymerase sigma-70 factor n=1 Tax=Desertivirga arenae TaxID=2810309 RepID=UPI001A962943|nr:RNA polymerase sigma-70 factor [Pedobacter sp. SYSU D00823]